MVYAFRRLWNAKRTWQLIAGIVVTHELVCLPGELLTQGCDEARAKHPILVIAACWFLAAHLTRALPKRYDPLTILSSWAGK
mgnify:CR=1